MTKAPCRVVELIETVARNIEAYHSQQNNEAKLRREFNTLFLEELGCDVTNTAGHARVYKDGIHTDKFKIGCFVTLPAKKPESSVKSTKLIKKSTSRFTTSTALAKKKYK